MFFVCHSLHFYNVMNIDEPLRSFPLRCRLLLLIVFQHTAPLCQVLPENIPPLAFLGSGIIRTRLNYCQQGTDRVDENLSFSTKDTNGKYSEVNEFHIWQYRGKGSFSYTNMKSRELPILAKKLQQVNFFNG